MSENSARQDRPDQHVGAGAPDKHSRLLDDLETTQRQMRRVLFWQALSRFGLILIGSAALLALADWLWVLPRLARGLVLLGALALAVAALFRSWPRVDRRQVALAVEQQFAELGQRVQTVVEYAHPGPETAPAAPGLVRALLDETDERTSGLDYQRVLPWPALIGGLTLLGLTLIPVIFGLLFWSDLRTAALRALLFRASYTTLNVEPGDTTVHAGDNLSVAVTLAGRPVRNARWLYRKAGDSGDWTAADLAPTEAEEHSKPRRLIGRFTTGLMNCQDDLDYRVEAGELLSPVYHVRVIQPLTIVKFEATVVPPSYTHRPKVIQREGTLRVIEGSDVQFSLALNREPRTAALVMGASGEPSPRTIPLSVQGTRLTGTMPKVTTEQSYAIVAEAADGVKLDPVSYQIKVQTDKGPTVRFICPEEELAVIPTAEVPIEIEGGDDFGIARVGIAYTVGSGPEESLYLHDYPDQPLMVRAAATLYLEKHKLSYTDGITYYAFVEDNRPDQPHRVVSELRFIDILPFKQAYQFVEGGGTCNGSSVTLEELIARQRSVLNRTFVHEQDAPVSAEVVRRLVKSQEELASATDRFAGGIAQRGEPIPALAEALAAMDQAKAALAEGKLDVARPHEQTALAGLVRARRNLRKLLSQSNQEQASTCRSFDRQEQQNLRRPPQDEKKRQLASLENNLRALAKEERAFSEQIEPRSGSAEPKGGPPASSHRDPIPRQQQAVKEAERLRELARQDESLTDRTCQRLGGATETIRKSAEEIQAGRPAEAAERARTAADQLQRLAQQVGALKASELADQMARTRDLTRALAAEQHAIEQALRAGRTDPNDQAASPWARRERDLAEDTSSVGELMDRLREEAAVVDTQLDRILSEAARSNPTREIEKILQQSALEVEAGRQSAAVQDAQSAGRRLDELARDLESARRLLVQPQLDRFRAAEKLAARVRDQMNSVRSGAQQAQAEQALSDLARSLESLASSGGSLRDAADRLNQALGPGAAREWRRDEAQAPIGSGLFIPPTDYTESVRTVALALQARIQQLVLDQALMERDEAVPPRYKTLVEDYYRVLSQDLR